MPQMFPSTLFLIFLFFFFSFSLFMTMVYWMQYKAVLSSVVTSESKKITEYKSQW